MGAGISGGEPPGAHETGGALLSRGLVLAPPAVISVLKSSNIPEKIILNLQGIWSTFIFGIFFNARIIQKTDG